MQWWQCIVSFLLGGLITWLIERRVSMRVIRQMEAYHYAMLRHIATAIPEKAEIIKRLIEEDYGKANEL